MFKKLIFSFNNLNFQWNELKIIFVARNTTFIDLVELIQKVKKQILQSAI